MSHGAFYQCFRCHAVVFRPQFLFQRSAVDADPDRDIPPRARLRDRLDVRFPADVARIDPDRVNSPLRADQRQFIIKVNIRDQGNGDLRLDFVNRFRRRRIRDGDADNLTAGVFQRVNLGYRGGHVLRSGVAHGLDSHRRAAAYRHVSHKQAFCHILFFSLRISTALSVFPRHLLIPPVLLSLWPLPLLSNRLSLSDRLSAVRKCGY